MLAHHHHVACPIRTIRGLILLQTLPVHFYGSWRFLYYPGFIWPVTSKIFLSVTKSRPYQVITIYHIYFIAQKLYWTELSNHLIRFALLDVLGLRTYAKLQYLIGGTSYFDDFLPAILGLLTTSFDFVSFWYSVFTDLNFPSDVAPHIHLRMIRQTCSNKELRFENGGQNVFTGGEVYPYGRILFIVKNVIAWWEWFMSGFKLTCLGH